MSRLANILAATERKVALERATCDRAELERRASLHAPRGFRRALDAVSQTGVAVIAELKRASPSKGVIRQDFNPAKLAAELEAQGAAALSVLTDQEFFHGSLENLRTASAATELPCLRKDFIIDEFQLLQARAYSADAILLIAAALSQPQLVLLARRARELDLDPLVEVHDAVELERALDAGSNLIGVNSRDLRTFRTDLATAFALAPQIPEGVLAVAESGIENGSHIAQLREAGYRAFLIGESLMRQPLPGQALETLLAEAGSMMKVGRG